MKAMLDPRIAAARIHGSAPFAHGSPGRPDLITASSHGVFMQASPKRRVYRDREDGKWKLESGRGQEARAKFEAGNSNKKLDGETRNLNFENRATAGAFVN
jgi:hypothetical protein